MNQNHEILFTPLQVGEITLKNRVILCPMEGTSIVEWLYECKFKKDCRDYYIERAKDGVGLMIPGLTPLKSMVGNKWLHENPQVFKGVKPLMDEIHQYGAKVFFQLGAGWGRSFTLPKRFTKFIDNPKLGKLMKPIVNMDDLMVAPDEGAPNVWLPDYTCRAITKAEIQEYVDAYAKAALLCKQSGVDGVEVHAVHEGYLMDQFTMPYTNHRTDEYGGSFENRYRFAVDVVKAIKALCGEDYPVSLRYSVVSKTKGFNDGAVPGETFVEAGRTMEESEKAIRYLEEAGYDMFNCDNGTYDAWYWAHPPVYMPLNCNLEEVRHIKHFTSKPVVCAGRMQLDESAEAIRAGDLDAVGIARQFLTDEEFLTKVREERLEDVRPCISCHSGCLPLATYKDGGFVLDLTKMKTQGCCALNPHTHNEKKYAVIPAKKPKTIAIIGGGIAGMEAAIQCAKRGHKVSLYEKSGELGGVFIAAAAPSFKEKDRDLIAWYIRELKKYPIEIHMNTEVKSLSDLKAEEVILATGAKARTLRVPGGEKAMDAISYLRGWQEVGDRVAIVGGGLTGCEIAYDLALKCKHPIVIEMMDDLIKAKGICAANSNLLRDLLKYHKVPVYLEAKTTAITDTSITIETAEGVKELSIDSVITSIGYNAGTALADPKKKDKHVHVIGDAEHVSNLMGAIWAANDLALKLSK